MNYVSFIILALLGTLQSVIKSPTLKAQFKDVLLRLRDAITLIYEPAALQGSVNKRTDPSQFLKNTLDIHAGNVMAASYQPGSFDLGTDPEPSKGKSHLKEVA
jgi:hypothetical protein